ncbi:MAG: FtsX-like permease family protein [Sphingomicrobium sp.]
MNWLVPPVAERRLLPGGGVRGATPWVMAIMMFVMIIVAAAGLALANVAGIVSAGVSQRYSIQLAAGQARQSAALAVAKAAPAVVAVRAVPQAEMRATLERWLGPAGAGADLPLPAMIDVNLAPGADPAIVGRRIEAAVPGARFVAHADSLGPLLSGLHAVSALAVALVLLVAAATAAVVVLATRGALDTNRATIEIMHGVGATDRELARLFQRRIAIDALTGGLAGGLVAAIALLAILGGGGGWIADLAGGAALHPRDLILLALLPFAIALLATLVARSAVLAALRSSL